LNWGSDARNHARDELKAKGLSDKEANAELNKRKDLADLAKKAPAGHLRRMVDPYDKSQDLTLRARSYLHSNCAQCHVEAGGGNVQMGLEVTPPRDKMRAGGDKPVHDSYGIAGARLVDPGHTERSVLLHRISHRQ